MVWIFSGERELTINKLQTHRDRDSDRDKEREMMRMSLIHAGAEAGLLENANPLIYPSSRWSRATDSWQFIYRGGNSRRWL